MILPTGNLVISILVVLCLINHPVVARNDTVCEDSEDFCTTTSKVFCEFGTIKSACRKTCGACEKEETAEVELPCDDQSPLCPEWKNDCNNDQIKSFCPLTCDACNGNESRRLIESPPLPPPPLPLITGWSMWTMWTFCNVSCGRGTQYRSRVCNQNVCPGEDLEEQECNTQSCPDPSQRTCWTAAQCRYPTSAILRSETIQIFPQQDGQATKGEPGINGIDGFPGPKGEPGIPGLEGLKGEKGEPAEGAFSSMEGRGPSGPKGDPGINGKRGIAGRRGAKGSSGPKGDQGIVGLKGEKGDPGYPITGSTIISQTGAKGDIGEPGLKGEKGDLGPKGEPGSSTLKGDKGAAGDAGPQGLKGRPGRRGRRGIKGIKGDQGVMGVPGAEGAPGLKGETGSRGLDGTMGEKGEPGHADLTVIKSIISAVCPIEYQSRCFLPITRNQLNAKEATQVCSSIGGNLANIYDADHMSMVMNYVRQHKMVKERAMVFHTGMYYISGPGVGKLKLRNGIDGFTDLKWRQNYPATNSTETFGVSLEVSFDDSSVEQYLFNSDYDILGYPLCEV